MTLSGTVFLQFSRECFHSPPVFSGTALSGASAADRRVPSCENKHTDTSWKRRPKFLTPGLNFSRNQPTRMRRSPLLCAQGEGQERSLEPRNLLPGSLLGKYCDKAAENEWTFCWRAEGRARFCLKKVLRRESWPRSATKRHGRCETSAASSTRSQQPV